MDNNRIYHLYMRVNFFEERIQQADQSITNLIGVIDKYKKLLKETEDELEECMKKTNAE